MSAATIDRALVDVGTLDRSTYLGSGDIGALLGVDPFRTPLDVYYAKTGERQAPPMPVDPKAEARKRRGKKLEPYVLEMLQEEYAIDVVGRNHRYRDSTYGFLAAEIDFEWRHGDGETENGEIKTVHPFAAGQWGDAESGDVPMHYAAQSMFGLMITGRELCQYAVLFGADDLTLYAVQRDAAMVEQIRETAVKFWRDNVLKRVPPPPRTFADLKALWPRDTGGAFAADSNFALLVEAYQIAHDREKAAKEQAEEARFQIAAAMGENTAAIFDGIRLCTYKAQKSKRIDSEALKRDLPELFAEYSKETEYRVLRIDK